ncbi:MAG: efflux transporter periplasmic adaptor subunit [Bacteroidetes bacterium]|nr:MAG: efflux transporter periplasmic adaptor subunit [Bacteroidota bacterium]
MKKYVIYTAILFGGFFLGWLIFGKNIPRDTDHNHDAVSEKGQIWTCSMHPQIRMKESGDCPICGMDLIPLKNSQSDNPMSIKMSPTAMQLANVQTAIISKGNAVKELQVNGKIQPDERYESTQTSHISGRIEQLKINYTGEQVYKGQVLAYIYSPELITAQKEVFEAQKIMRLQPKLFIAAKEKLKNWKLSDNTINGIIETGKIIENFPVRADISGIVTDKLVNQGDYINRGEPLYKISNLNKLWILFDLYESDLSWVKKGDRVTYSLNAVSGKTFEGNIAFIDPVVNPKTRTSKARIEVNNTNEKLKPEMLVNGTIKSSISANGNTIVVPKTAVMWTGKKSIVYKKLESSDGVSFMLTKVTLGPSLGDSYIIQSGITEGDEIAINGTFSIDAAAQLAGKPSMMNPEGGKSSVGHNHGGASMQMDNQKSSVVSISSEANNSLKNLFDSYMKIKNNLVQDDFESSQESLLEFEIQLKQISMSLFKGENHNIWMKHSVTLKKLIIQYKTSIDVKEARDNFIHISEQMIMIGKSLKPKLDKIYVQYCPMADRNNGARWLSKSKNIMNPYFGEAMLKCGEVKEEF